MTEIIWFRLCGHGVQHCWTPTKNGPLWKAGPTNVARGIPKSGGKPPHSIDDNALPAGMGGAAERACRLQERRSLPRRLSLPAAELCRSANPEAEEHPGRNVRADAVWPALRCSPKAPQRAKRRVRCAG